MQNGESEKKQNLIHSSKIDLLIIPRVPGSLL